MTLNLTEEEASALAKHLREALDYARYPFAPQLDPLKAILAKLEPPGLQPEPLLPLKGGLAPSVGRGEAETVTTESWLFLFAAIPATGTLLAFFRIDALTIARLWSASPAQGGTRHCTGRDIIISVFIVLSLVFSGLGLALTIGQEPPHLSDSQKRTLLS